MKADTSCRSFRAVIPAERKVIYMDAILDLDELVEDILDEGDPEKMFTYLRGYFKGAQMHESMAALGFARRKHSKQRRKGNNKPYIIHPLSIACFAAGIGLRIDDYLAAMLLHDVPEDTGTPLSSLPVNEHVKQIVNLLTVKPTANESKWEYKKRYYIDLLDDPGAILGKGGDRFHNLSTMEGEMPIESIEKNVVETKYLLLPVMKEAKDMWPDYYDFINTYRYILKVVCRILIRSHNITTERELEIIEGMKHTPAVDLKHKSKESQ